MTNNPFKKALKTRLKFDEGYSKRAYKCTAGYWSIGVGRNLEGNLLSSADRDRIVLEVMRAGASPTLYTCGDRAVLGFDLTQVSISNEMVEHLLEIDTNVAISSCVYLLGVHTWASLPNEIKLVLANMSFQLGQLRFSTFRKMFVCIRAKDWKGMAAEMLDSKWAKLDTPSRAHKLAKEVLHYANTLDANATRPGSIPTSDT